jgi:hypothetical protein
VRRRATSEVRIGFTSESGDSYPEGKDAFTSELGDSDPKVRMHLLLN